MSAGVILTVSALVRCKSIGVLVLVLVDLVQFLQITCFELWKPLPHIALLHSHTHTKL